MADEESPDVAGPVSHTFDAISGLYDQYGDSKTGKAMGLAGSGVAAGAAMTKRLTVAFGLQKIDRFFKKLGMAHLGRNYGVRLTNLHKNP